MKSEISNNDGAQSGASLPPRNGSVLQSLVISKEAAGKARTEFRFVREMRKAISDEELDTLADWWCVFNAREWPSDPGVQRPFEEHQAQMFGLRLIESLLSRTNGRNLSRSHGYAS